MIEENNSVGASPAILYPKGTFGYDLHFVRQHAQVVVLMGKDENTRVLTTPTYQGRVLTSTFAGENGPSLGWVNHERIASDRIQPHIQAYGGEDRFWIGPQGGQYTLFFNPGDPFDFDHWFTPAPLDMEPFELVSQNGRSVRYHKKMQLTNYARTPFEVAVNREIRLIDRAAAASLTGLSRLDEDLPYVGFESINEMVNAGTVAWTKEKGLLSIWILGMFPASPSATVVIPYRPETDTQRGPVANEYFTDQLGQLPPNRLKTSDRAVYYKADGNYCSKIGLAPPRARPFFGSYNPHTRVLTLVHYSLPDGAAEYVNSSWEIQKDAYAGDAVNAYNDGTLDHTPTPNGTYYELESSSPALPLRPGQKVVHIHRTMHFQGDEAQLDAIAEATLGVPIDQIKGALGEP